MDDTESRVAEAVEDRPTGENLREALETLRGIESRDDDTERLTAEVAYLLACRAEDRGDADRMESYLHVALDHIGAADTSSQQQCRPILSLDLPELMTEDVIERKLPADSS